jgi:hypothetical protein
MANPNPQREYLVPQATRWQHLPTAVVRIPECFIDRAMNLVRSWDRGQDIGEFELQHLSVEQLIALQNRITPLLNTKREAFKDRRLEAAIAFLASNCDGAARQDNIGFNQFDAAYGNWLAGCELTRHHARQALDLLQKYRKNQLEPNGYTLPSWEAIAHQYSETQTKPLQSEQDSQNKPEKRIEILGSGVIAVYHPYDPCGKFQWIAKSIKGYRFEGADKSWRYPLTQILNVLEAFRDYELELTEEVLGEVTYQQSLAAIAEKAKEAEVLQKSEHILELLQLANLSTPLANGWTLREYQKSGVEWLLTHSKGGIAQGGILADDMGLGKTLTALSAAKVLKQKHHCPIFVVCPVSLVENWLREAERVEVEIECFSWTKVPSPLESNYILIADEAHYAQNDQAARTAKLIALARSPHCLATWLLTGTPIKNGRPVNLLPLLTAIDHLLSRDRWAYLKRYCDAHQKSVGHGKSVWDVSGCAFLNELSQKTEDAILRRTKKDCLLELPEKTRILRTVELEPPQLKDYRAKIKQLVHDYRERAKRGEVDPDAEALVTLNLLRKAGSVAKVPAVIQFIQGLLEQDQQVVVFTEFVESAKAIHTALGGELLTGDTRGRQAMVDRFQSGESTVFVGTIKAGGIGITLTASSSVILVDRPWTPGDANQAEDRVHRIGQTKGCFAYWMQLGQIDTAIDSLIHSKQERIELMLNGKRKTLRGIKTVQDLAKELLSIL